MTSLGLPQRETILNHLIQAERHVNEGAQLIRRQMEIVAELERDGHDTVASRELLRTFEELQAMHVSDRDRLRKELAESG